MITHTRWSSYECKYYICRPQWRRCILIFTHNPHANTCHALATQRKLRKAQLDQFNYMLVIGDKVHFFGSTRGNYFAYSRRSCTHTHTHTHTLLHIHTYTHIVVVCAYLTCVYPLCLLNMCTHAHVLPCCFGSFCLCLCPFGVRGMHTYDCECVRVRVRVRAY